jgi:hypothetical protein
LAHVLRQPPGKDADREVEAMSASSPRLDDAIRSEIGTWRLGTIYSTCPECSAERRKKRAKCLSITVQDDRAVFCCHHCEARGVVWRDGGTSLSRAKWTERQKAAEKAVQADLEQRVNWAHQIWNKAVPALGTPVQTYLRSRGIDLADIPLTLRYARLRHPGTGETYDVMVAAVGYGPVPDAIHRTFLAPGGTGKARLPDDLNAKLSLGPIRGLPIRLDATSDADAAAGALAVGEGIENALVSVQEFGVPAWSSISAGNMPLLRVPDTYPLITILADHDPVGLRKAREAGQLWVVAGHTVRLALPPVAGQDFNNMLKAARRTDTQEGTA